MVAASQRFMLPLGLKLPSVLPVMMPRAYISRISSLQPEASTSAQSKIMLSRPVEETESSFRIFLTALAVYFAALALVMGLSRSLSASSSAAQTPCSTAAFIAPMAQWPSAEG